MLIPFEHSKKILAGLRPQRNFYGINFASNIKFFCKNKPQIGERKMFNFDNALDFHARALNLRSKQSEIIANNLANVDTPGFKAKDLNFNQAMQQFMGETLSLSGDQAGHITIQNDPFGMTGIQLRSTQTMALDGNTVDKDIETVAFAKNATDYQASLTFINGSIKSLRTAIKGE